MTAVLEPCPVEQAMLEFPAYGGTVGFDAEGVGFCAGCGWRGAATITDGVISTHCPVCSPQIEPPEGPRKVPRNAPCPCGSGVKAKRCDCAAYVV